MRNITILTAVIIAAMWAAWLTISTNSIDPAAHPLPKLSTAVIDQVHSDLRLSDLDLTEYKEDFSDYYKSDIAPRIENLSNHIGNRSFIQLSDQHYALWTEGVAPSAWGAKEFLYILSTASGKLEIVASSQLDPEPSRTADGYHTSSFWVNPNKGCGYNDFVVGVLQYLKVGGSGSTAYQVIIKYNRYKEQYEITTQSSPIFYSKPACAAH